MVKTNYTAAAILLLIIGPALAERTPVPAAVPGVGIRVGSPGTGVPDTVIFDVDGNQAGNGTPVDSTNVIAGGSGDFTVQFRMETRPPPANATGQFFGDSTQPLSCTSPLTCAATTIPFTTISWTTRDGDMLELATAFSGSDQLLHEQTDNIFGGATFGLRITDYVKFSFNNSELLPAGTYRGTVNFKGTYPPPPPGL